MAGRPIGPTDTRQGWIPAFRRAQVKLFGEMTATRCGSPRQLGLAVGNAAERELFFSEGSTNVYENKGPMRRDEDGSRNIFENKGTYPRLAGIYVKTRKLVMPWKLRCRPIRQNVMAGLRLVLPGLSPVRRYRRRSATIVT